MKNDKEIYKKARGFDKNPQNINRKGTPGKSVTKVLKELLAEKIADVEIILTNEKGEKKIKKLKLETKGDFNSALAVILLQKALSGDLQALRELLDRTEGKPLQKVEQSIDTVPKINIIVENEDTVNEVKKLSNETD